MYVKFGQNDMICYAIRTINVILIHFTGWTNYQVSDVIQRNNQASEFDVYRNIAGIRIGFVYRLFYDETKKVSRIVGWKKVHNSYNSISLSS